MSRKQTYLWRRGATYYFRRRVPKDLVVHYGCKVLKCSLHTTNLMEAGERVQLKAAEVAREFAALRRARRVGQGGIVATIRDLDDLTIESLTNLWSADALEGDEQFYLHDVAHLDDASFAARHAELREVEAELRQAMARGQTQRIEPALTAYLHLRGIDLQVDANAFHKLAWQFLKASLTVTQARLRRMQGEVVETRAVAPAEHCLAVKGETEKPVTAGRESLEDLFKRWERAVADRDPLTVKDMYRALSGFRDFVKNIAAAAVERRHVRSYRDHLVESGLHFKTVEKRVGQIRTLFQVAVEDEVLATNPANRVKIARPKVRPKAVVPYEAHELRLIFTSPVYTEGWRPSRASVGEAAAWLPLLALYTGARLEELGQLQVADVRESSGIHFLHISDESDGQTVKTESSRRRVPLHPKLLDAGFLRYVDRIRQAGHVQLFPALRRSPKGKLTDGFSKWWGRYARGLGIEKSRRKVFHSLRHGFKDAVREAGVTEEINDALTGHSGGGVGRSYGSGQFPLRQLAEAMARVDYPDVPLPIVISE